MRYILIFVATFFLLSGCGSSKRTGSAPTYQVSGVVTYKGKPVEGADITFYSAERSLSSFGRTNSEGKYQMTTFSSNDGAPAGKMTVTISKVEVAAPVTTPTVDVTSQAYVPPEYGVSTAPKAPAKPAIPAKYANQTQSGLIAVVQESNDNTINFELTD